MKKILMYIALVILFSAFVFSFQDTIIPTTIITKGNSCLFNSSCVLKALVVENLTVSNLVNATVTSYFVTGDINATGNITADWCKAKVNWSDVQNEPDFIINNYYGNYQFKSDTTDETPIDIKDSDFGMTILQASRTGNQLYTDMEIVAVGGFQDWSMEDGMVKNVGGKYVHANPNVDYIATESDPVAHSYFETFFGTGKDGNVVLTEDFKMNRTMFFNNLTIEEGVTLDYNGFNIYVADTLINYGNISVPKCSPGHASGANGGSFSCPTVNGIETGARQNSQHGRAAPNACPVSSPTITYYYGGRAGKGGAGGNGTGTGPQPLAIPGSNDYNYIAYELFTIDDLVNGQQLKASAGTMGGCSGDAGSGAGGGGAVGAKIIAKHIKNYGYINSEGSDGGNGGYINDGVSLKSGGGPGNGGPGGRIKLMYFTYEGTGYLSVRGGHAGQIGLGYNAGVLYPAANSGTAEEGYPGVVVALDLDDLIVADLSDYTLTSWT